MNKLGTTAVLLFSVCLLAWMTGGVQGKEVKRKRLTLPEVRLHNRYDELIFIEPQGILGYNITRSSVSSTESKSLTLCFKDLPSPPGVVVSTYLYTAAIPVERQSPRLKDVVNLEVISDRVDNPDRSDHLSIETRNHLTWQPLEIIVTGNGRRMRFLWWTTGGPLEPLSENFCLEQDGQSYLFDKERGIWLLVHPDTIEQHLKDYTLIRTIRN